MSIVISGPTSLFAILSLIRQSISSFQIEERAKIIQKDLLKFQDEWLKYKDKMDSVQAKMDQASKALEEAQGTRTRALERPLNKILNHELKEKIRLLSLPLQFLIQFSLLPYGQYSHLDG